MKTCLWKQAAVRLPPANPARRVLPVWGQAMLSFPLSARQETLDVSDLGIKNNSPENVKIETDVKRRRQRNRKSK